MGAAQRWSAVMAGGVLSGPCMPHVLPVSGDGYPRRLSPLSPLSSTLRDWLAPDARYGVRGGKHRDGRPCRTKIVASCCCSSLMLEVARLDHVGLSGRGDLRTSTRRWLRARTSTRRRLRTRSSAPGRLGRRHSAGSPG